MSVLANAHSPPLHCARHSSFGGSLLSLVDSSSGVASTAAELAAHTRRQIALRLLPFLFVLYIANYIDRTSVAYAALGMTSDLGFSDRVFGLGAGIFFFSYVALQVPGAMLVEHWSARRLISGVMIAWGTLTALTGLVHTAHQLYAARLLLGAAEAAFFPGVIVYLSHWFLRADRGKATGYFMSAIPLSQALASPVAGWIVGHAFLGMQGWRWLFILEGAPAIILGAFAYFFLRDRPREAHWLAPGRQQWIEQKLEAEEFAMREEMPVSHALWLVPLLAVTAFLNYVVGYGFYFWFPTMLKRQSGLSDIGVGVVGVIPYLVMFAAMVLNGWHSDKRLERRWHSAIPMFLAAVGALGIIANFRSLPVMVLFFTLIASGNAFLPTFWAIPTSLLSRSAAAASVGLINGVASVGGFVGPYLLGYLSTRSGSFRSGMLAVAGAAVACSLMLFLVPRATTASPVNRDVA